MRDLLRGAVFYAVLLAVIAGIDLLLGARP